MLADFLVCFRITHRSRLTHLIGVVTLVVIVACVMAAQFSGRQPATVALDVGLSVQRLLLPILALLLLQELFYREFDRKYYLLSLTYPRPRVRFLLARGASTLLYTWIALAVSSIALLIAVQSIANGYSQATPPDLGSKLFITLLFLALDLFLVISVGILISITASSAAFVLVGTLGFLLCARSYSPIIELLGRDNTLVRHTEAYQSSLSILGYLIPDLAKLDVRMIALYNNMAFLPEHWLSVCISVVAYAVALLCISTWLLERRRFS